jgi:DNA-binding MarR family transcriptional regulator
MAVREKVGAPAQGRADASARAPKWDPVASEVLLAFSRMARGHRPARDIPSRVESLIESGFLAQRHLSVLAVVALAGPLAVSELASREGLAISTMSLLVTQLAESGLVERREDESDRRRTVVSIAPEYRTESEQILQAKLAPLERAIARMGRARANVFLEGLNIVAEEVGSLPGIATTDETGGKSKEETA